MTEPTPDHQSPQPFQAFIEGQATKLARTNTAIVQADTLYDGGPEEDPDEPYADSFGRRRLVLLDTNYKAKPGPAGEHPVYLARTDALRTASALLDSTADTFHTRRCGPLRPSEAADVLRELDTVQDSLSQLRSNALADLLHGTVDKPDDDLDDLDDDDEEAGI